MTQIILGICAIKAFAADMATAEDTGPPVRTESKNLCTILSRLAQSNGLPPGNTLKSLLQKNG